MFEFSKTDFGFGFSVVDLGGVSREILTFRPSQSWMSICERVLGETELVAIRQLQPRRNHQMYDDNEEGKAE